MMNVLRGKPPGRFFFNGRWTMYRSALLYLMLYLVLSLSWSGWPYPDGVSDAAAGQADSINFPNIPLGAGLFF